MRPSMGGSYGGMGRGMGRGMGNRYNNDEDDDDYDDYDDDDQDSLYNSRYAHPPPRRAPPRPQPGRYESYSAPGRRLRGFIYPASIPSDVDDLGPDSDYGSNAADPGEFRYGAPDAGYWDSFNN